MAFGFLHCSMLCLLITLQAGLLHLLWLVTMFFATVNFTDFWKCWVHLFFVITVHVATLGEALCLLFGQNNEHLMMVCPTVGFCHMSVKVVLIPSLLYNYTLLNKEKKDLPFKGVWFYHKQTDKSVLQCSFIVFLLCGYCHRTVVACVLCIIVRAAAAVGCWMFSVLLIKKKKLHSLLLPRCSSQVINATNTKLVACSWVDVCLCFSLCDNFAWLVVSG